MERFKYPRTFHLPWSSGRSQDDRIHEELSFFEGKEVSVSFKMDGECTCVYSDGFVHARSTSGAPHPSRNWMRKYAAEFAYKLPTGYRVYGESCFAKHSIALENLPSFFLVFAVVTEENEWLSLDDTLDFCRELNLTHVPIIYRGLWDIKQVKSCFQGKDIFGNAQEGYVVRLAQSFHYSDFETSMAKYVRANHVQTDQHWMNSEIIPNRMLGHEDKT